MKNRRIGRLRAIPWISLPVLSSTLTIGVPTSAAAAQDVLEEVIVTARKREESLQETPVAVSAFSGLSLQEAGMRNLSDLRAVVPNVDVYGGNGTGGAANVFIRGVGARNTGVNFDSGVGIYLDGVYLSRPDGAILDNVDIQSVQVLRGPQGTLFGKNTTGGAILYTTNRPGDTFEGNAEVRAGNYGRLDGKVTVNVPLVKELMYSRLSLFSTKRDGYTKNLVNDKNYTDEDRLGGQLQFRFLGGDNVIVDLNTNYSKTNQYARGQKCLPATGIPGAGWQAALQDPLVIAETGKSIMQHCEDSAALERDEILSDLEPNLYQAETTGASVTVDWDINGQSSFKSISAWRHTKAGAASDLDAIGIPLFGRTNFAYTIAEPRETSQYSQEFQFNGTAFNETVDYVVGAMGFWEKTDRGIAPGPQGPFGLPFPPFGPNAAITFYNANATELLTDNSAYAAFSQVDWNFTENWRLTAGLRYTWEERKLDRNVYVPDPNTLVTAGAPPLGFPGPTWVFFEGSQSLNPNHLFVPSPLDTGRKSGSVTNSAWTPMASIQYLFDGAGAVNSGSVYFTIATGFLSGGLSESLDLFTGEIAEYDPEKTINYEVGFKVDAFDSTLRFNSALFFTNYTDRQLTSVRLNPDTGSIAGTTINAKKSSILGLELETMWIPVPNFDITLNMAFNRGDIQEYDDIRLVIPGSIPDGNCVNVPSASVDACPVDRSDEDLPRLPTQTYFLAFQYTWETGIGSVIPRLQASYRKNVNNCFDRSSCLLDLYEVDQYDLSARLTWLSPGDAWRVTAYGNNLTNYRYIEGGTPLVDVTETAGVIYNAPKMYGVEVAFNW